MIERKLKGDVGIGIKARDRNQGELKRPLLARLVEGDDMRQLMSNYVFDPVVGTAQLEIETGGPDRHGIAVVIGPAIAQAIRIVKDDDVDSTKIVVVVVRRRQRRKDFFAGLGNPPCRRLCSGGKMDPEMIGRNGLDGMSCSGEQQHHGKGENHSTQSAYLS